MLYLILLRDISSQFIIFKDRIDSADVSIVNGSRERGVLNEPILQRAILPTE